MRAVVNDMGLETMTDVQSQTIHQALKGTDAVAQAKTGTGKTLGFLLPVLHRITQHDPQLAKTGYRRSRTTPDDIRAIIISPTRELAEQIAVEAKKLTRHTSIVVQTAVGGTQKRAKLREMQRDGCHVLVGTPGRLQDIFSDEFSRVSAPGLEALVLDEADRLLDQGFWENIEQFIAMLPDRKQHDRQTLMFSATMPDDVQSLVMQTLKPDFQVVQTVQQDEEPTHERVPQYKVQCRGLENTIPTLLELCSREIKNATTDSTARPFKAIIYCNANKEITVLAELFKGLRSTSSDPNARSTFQDHPLRPAKIIEINSRLSQAQRDRATSDFRRCETGILISSDVTARGMDYPDVTHVIQLGLATSREQYIHRLGRTARAGKEGEGWILTNDMEAYEFRQRLKGMRITPDTSLACATADFASAAEDSNSSLSPAVSETLEQLVTSAQRIPRAEKVGAYKSMLGTHQFVQRKDQLIKGLNNLAKHVWALDAPPMISPTLASRLGLRRTPGIALGYEDDEESSSSAGSGRGFSTSRGGAGGSGGARSLGRDRERGRSFGGRSNSFSNDSGSRGSERGGSERGGFDRGSERGGFDRGSERSGFKDRRGGGSGGDRRSSFGGRGRSDRGFDRSAARE